MIRGPETVITYDPAEFPGLFNKPEENRSLPKFIRKYQPELVDEGDLIITDIRDSKSFERCNLHNKKFDRSVGRVTDTMVKITYDFRFVKRSDLLPRFSSVVAIGTGFIVDDQYFPTITDAFLSMFTIVRNEIVHKHWMSYSHMCSEINLSDSIVNSINSSVQQLKEQIKEIPILNEKITTISTRLDEKDTTIGLSKQSVTKAYKLCSGIHNRLVATERRIDKRLNAMETTEYEAIIDCLTSRLELAETRLQLLEGSVPKPPTAMNMSVYYFLALVSLVCLFVFV